MFTQRTLTVLGVALAALLVVGIAVAAVAPPSSSAATDDTTSTTSTTTSATSTTIRNPGADEVNEYAAGDAGTVTVLFAAGALEIVDVDANPGWATEVEQAAGREVEVRFTNRNRRIDFEAELEDGAVKVRVRERTVDEDGSNTTTTTMAPPSDDPPAQDIVAIDASPAGTVFVSVTNGDVDLVDVVVNPPWTVSYRADGDDVEVDFRNGDAEVEVEVEWEDGALEVEVDVDLDDGPSSDGSDDDDADDDDSDDDGSDDDRSDVGDSDDDDSDDDGSDDSDSGDDGSGGGDDDDDHDDDDDDDDPNSDDGEDDRDRSSNG